MAFILEEGTRRRAHIIQDDEDLLYGVLDSLDCLVKMS